MKAAISSILMLLPASTTAAFMSRWNVKPPNFLQALKPLTETPVLPKLDLPVVNDADVKPVRNAQGRKEWGIDKHNKDEYWFDDRIHTLGNYGFWGAVHAAVAPISTKIIDVVAYDGVDIRLQVAKKLSDIVRNPHARVVDLCCGVGMSTRALNDAFPEAEAVIGVDTSPQMLAMAGFLSKHLSFFQSIAAAIAKRWSTTLAAMKEQGSKMKKAAEIASVCTTARFLNANAEATQLPEKFYDLVTVMYAFHEAPLEGREHILAEARRILKPGGHLAVVDITTDYTPSESMLSGEPYVLEYQRTIHNQIRHFKGFFRSEYETLVPGHVGMWLLKRSPNAV